MQCSMSDESRNRAPGQDPPYRIYRGGQTARPAEPSRGRISSGERPYTKYRSTPRGLRSRLRGEQVETLAPPRRGGDDGRPRVGPAGPWYRRITFKRVLKYLAIAIGAWLLLSLVLFIVSAQTGGGIPRSAQ